MKWIAVVKEYLDAASIPQAGVNRQETHFWVREKSSKRPEEFGLMRGGE